MNISIYNAIITFTCIPGAETGPGEDAAPGEEILAFAHLSPCCWPGGEGLTEISINKY